MRTQLLECHPLQHVAWHTAVLPPTKEHALCLRVPVAAGSGDASPEELIAGSKELLLRSKSREKVEELQMRLYAAALEAEHMSPLCLAMEQQQRQSHEQLQRQRQQQEQQPQQPQQPQQQPTPLQQRPAGPEEDTACPQSVSFGSPVADLNGEEQGDSGSSRGSGPQRPHATAKPAKRPGSAPPTGSRYIEETDGCLAARGDGAGGHDGCARHSPSCFGCWSPEGQLRSAPPSPVLPGLALVEKARRPAASAPVSPAYALKSRGSTAGAGVPAQQQELLIKARKVLLQQPSPPPPPQQQRREEEWSPEEERAEEEEEEEEAEDAVPATYLPVRLLSFSGRPASGAAAAQLSSVQQLEAAVTQLSRELAQSRRSNCSSLTGSPVKARGGGSGIQAAPAAASAPAEAQAVRAAPPAAPEAAMPAAAVSAAAPTVSPPPAASPRHVELLLAENAALVQQQAALQGELGRMQNQLSAAAADNIRIAQEAAAAVRQLQAAAAALAGGQQREQQLRVALEGAVGQCEAVGRELAGLSGKLEARGAQCQELR